MNALAAGPDDEDPTLESTSSDDSKEITRIRVIETLCSRASAERSHFTTERKTEILYLANGR